MIQNTTHIHDETGPKPDEAAENLTDIALNPTLAIPKSKSGYIDPDERTPTGSSANAQTAEEIMNANNFLGDLS